MHPATQLKTLLKQPGILKIAGAHDALSAKLVQEAGFDGIWAGGFSISVKQVYHELQKCELHKGVHESPSLEQASLTDMLQVLIEAGQEVQAIFTYKGWMDVDSFEDYQKAWAEIS